MACSHASGAHERGFCTGGWAGHHRNDSVALTRDRQQRQIVGVVRAIRGIEVDAGHVIERLVVGVKQDTGSGGVGEHDQMRARVQQLIRVADQLQRGSHGSTVVKRHEPSACFLARPGMSTDFSVATVSEQRCVG